MNDFRIPGEVSGDPIVGPLQAGGIFTVLVDHAERGRSGSVDKANFFRFGDDEKGDVIIQTNDPNAGSTGDDLIEELLVGCSRFNVHLLFRDEGAYDALGRLLGEADSLDVKSRIAKNR